MKPFIGVTPDFKARDCQELGREEPTYFLRARYTQAIEDAGGIPLIFPLILGRDAWQRLVSQVDGLLITGSGSDLTPELYGETQDYPLKPMNSKRAMLELGISKIAYRTDMPILGICGGMQSINVALGGTLYQDIPSQITTDIEHLPTYSATQTTHSVQITPRSLLHRIARTSCMAVNSSHHQSVKKVAPKLIQTAVSPDGVIEAIEAPDRSFVLGVQWHPEFLNDRDPIQKRLFQALVRAGKQFSRRKASA